MTHLGCKHNNIMPTVTEIIDGPKTKTLAKSSDQSHV